MSSDLYYRRLYYQKGRVGLAKNGDVEFHLHRPPAIFPLATEIDFGETSAGNLAYPPEIRPSDGEPKREMLPPEIIVVRMLLFGLLDAAVRAVMTAIPIQADRRKDQR